ncbi:metalloregulator ArsR/SmtB family transcription factor [Nitrincola alkalilacustris]|uniref:metalloregulator ArsR/SmtB family transcription factor n=1 Tax=Nitrincola alkalilacustris TaxID=1571224 RepID=UPI00124C6B02|nr:metalloregulator ArsR/SmtB family transcription factor [Nitrincola alkalilacustris]
MNPVVFFKCLSDNTRLRITALLTVEKELCVCELMAVLKESQPKISRHLALLRNCGLLLDERRGQWVYYRINPQLPEWATAVLAQLEQADQSGLVAGLNTLKQFRESSGLPLCS